MSKSNRKATSNDVYSHPLLKDAYTPVEESKGSVVPSYVPIRANNSDRISAKIVRHAEMVGDSDKIEMYMSVNIFDEAVATLPVVEQTAECINCQTKINCLTVVDNHAEMKCNLCCRTTHINLTNYEELKAHHAFRIQQQTQNNKENQSRGDTKRRVLFVIEASQYNYQSNIHASIFSCLKAMQGQNLQIAFVLFDDRYAIFVLPATMEITKVALLENESLVDWTSLPVQQSDLFVERGECLEELEEIVQAMMYQSFLIKQTIVGQVTKMVQKMISETVQIKCFVTTFNSPTNVKTQQLVDVFKEKQNTMQSTIVKKLPFISQTKTKMQSQIYKSNMNFFVITANTNYKQAVDRCQYTLAKIYSVKDRATVQNQLYYDLYQNLTTPKQNNIEVTIRTSKDVELHCNDNHISTLYSKITITKQPSNQKMNKYTVMVKQADHQFSLPLHFTYKHSNNNHSQQLPFIQLEYHNQFNNNQLIVCNVQPKVDLGQNWLQNIDDEVVFNHQLRKCLSAWDDQNYKQLKQTLLQEYTSIVRLFIDQNDSYNIIFPKSWKHYLLYSHLFEQKLIQGMLNPYEIYKLLNKSLESFSKYFYYRVYKLEESKVKNIKFTRSVFEKYEILFVENGEFVYMVMREPPVQVVKEIFGYYDSNASLANTHLELPILESNQQYRNAIETIRNLYQSNFLPLRIIDYQSHNFSSLIQNKLYEKEKHLTFLRRLWREA